MMLQATETALATLVGGPAHGQQIRVPKSLPPEITVQRPVPTSGIIRPDGRPASNPKVHRLVYQRGNARVDLTGQLTCQYVFVSESTVDEKPGGM